MAMAPPIRRVVFSTTHLVFLPFSSQGSVFRRNGGIIIQPAVMRQITDTQKNIAALLINSALFILNSAIEFSGHYEIMFSRTARFIMSLAGFALLVIACASPDWSRVKPLNRGLWNMCTDGKQCMKVLSTNYTKANQILSILAIVLLGVCIIALPLWKYLASSTYFDVYPFILLFVFSFSACTAIFYTIELGSQTISWAYVLQWIGIAAVTLATIFAFMRFRNNSSNPTDHYRPYSMFRGYNPDDGRTLY